MAFNGQDHWRKKEWLAYKDWIEKRVGEKDKRLHHLRYKSAIIRRRLDYILKHLPPNFDGNVKKASNVYNASDGGSPFIPVWTPSSGPLGPIVLSGNVKPQTSTGKHSQPVRDYVYREIRLVEYYEHMLQKTRFELEQIEDEIWWLEMMPAKTSKHLGAIDGQWSNPEYSENLLLDDTLINETIFDHLQKRLIDAKQRALQVAESIIGKPYTPHGDA